MSQVTPLAVVCIPSFRRPDGLLTALKSLSLQQVDFPFAVVVVDNDARDQAALTIGPEGLSRNALQGQVVLESQQGNVYAINRAFSTARQTYPDAAYFLMMDDDEEASPQWLAQMVKAAQFYKADIVGGPVYRRFEREADASVAQHPLFLSLDGPSGIIDQIHGSGNCLLSASVFQKLEFPQFDTQFNFLGGGDMDFFTRCRLAGLKTAWSAEAIIYEDVPQARMQPRWIMERSLRTGIINYNIDKSRKPGMTGTALLTLKNIASLGLSVPRAIEALIRTKRFLPASHPILMSIGRILASLGITLSPYKATKITGQKQL